MKYRIYNKTLGAAMNKSYGYHWAARGDTTGKLFPSERSARTHGIKSRLVKDALKDGHEIVIEELDLVVVKEIEA